MRIEDDNAQRDQSRKMIWWVLAGMLGYPFFVIVSSYMGLNAASDILGSMATIYFPATSLILGAFLRGQRLSSQKGLTMLQALIGPVTGILDKFIEDKDQKAALAHEIATMSERHAQELAKGQLEINKAEAASGSVFKGGWRPFIGWVCGIAFAYHFVLQPLIVFGVTAAGVEIPELPSFDMGSLMTVMMGMLGLGGLRSYEKKQGLTK